jgi:hypothetical protein
MSSTERCRRRRDRFLAQGLCGQCGEHPTGEGRCPKADALIAYRSLWKSEHRCTKCGGGLPEGYGFKCCEGCRLYARNRYIPVVRAWGPRKSPVTARLPETSAKLEALDWSVRCERCGLRGEHVCLSRGAYASARRSA